MSDSEGAAAARAGMAWSVNENRQEVALAGETIDLIRSEIRLAVAEGITDGFTKAMTEENAEILFNKFFEVMRRQATVKTGTFILGGVGSAAKTLVYFGIAAAVLWNLGGWAAVKAAWLAVQNARP